jgi:aryl-alcohol dehydrogenase-like predicted oxidoreductase
LAAGFLTGKYRNEADLSKSVRGGGAQKYLNEKGLSVLASLDSIAEKHNTQQAAVALAWLLAQPNIGAAIASATSKTQLATLFEATELKLDKEDLDFIRPKVNNSKKKLNSSLI